MQLGNLKKEVNQDSGVFILFDFEVESQKVGFLVRLIVPNTDLGNSFILGIKDGVEDTAEGVKTLISKYSSLFKQKPKINITNCNSELKARYMEQQFYTGDFETYKITNVSISITGNNLIF